MAIIPSELEIFRTQNTKVSKNDIKLWHSIFSFYFYNFLISYIVTAIFSKYLKKEKNMQTCYITVNVKFYTNVIIPHM